MTLRLILTRHAKSSWDDPLMDDHDRPLNKRGQAAAAAVGAWLAESGHIPDQVLVSSAERTRETWKLIARALGPVAPKAERVPALYHAEPEALLTVLRAAQGRTVMLVAHNPGLAFFARGLAENAPADVRFERYPTAATTVLAFDKLERWSRLTWRRGEVVDFVVPRDLMEAA